MEEQTGSIHEAAPSNEHPDLTHVTAIDEKYMKFYTGCGDFHLKTAQEIQEAKQRKKTLYGEQKPAATVLRGEPVRSFTAKTVEINDIENSLTASHISFFADTPEQKMQKYGDDELVPSSTTRIQGIDENGQTVVAECTRYTTGKLDPRNDMNVRSRYEYHYEVGGSEVTFPAEKPNPLAIEDQRRIATVLGLPQK